MLLTSCIYLQLAVCYLTLLLVNVSARRNGNNYILRAGQTTEDPSKALGYKNRIIRLACAHYYETDSAECGATRVCGNITAENRIAKFENECIFQGYICLGDREVDHVDMEKCKSRKVKYYNYHFHKLFKPKEVVEIPLKDNYLGKLKNFLSQLSAKILFGIREDSAESA